MRFGKKKSGVSNQLRDKKVGGTSVSSEGGGLKLELIKCEIKSWHEIDDDCKEKKEEGPEKKQPSFENEEYQEGKKKQPTGNGIKNSMLLLEEKEAETREEPISSEGETQKSYRHIDEKQEKEKMTEESEEIRNGNISNQAIRKEVTKNYDSPSLLNETEEQSISVEGTKSYHNQSTLDEAEEGALAKEKVGSGHLGEEKEEAKEEAFRRDDLKPVADESSVHSFLTLSTLTMLDKIAPMPLESKDKNRAYFWPQENFAPMPSDNNDTIQVWISSADKAMYEFVASRQKTLDQLDSKCRDYGENYSFSLPTLFTDEEYQNDEEKEAREPLDNDDVNNSKGEIIANEGYAPNEGNFSRQTAMNMANFFEGIFLCADSLLCAYAGDTEAPGEVAITTSS